MSEGANWFPSSRAIIGIVVLVVLTTGAVLVGCPIYGVWSARKAGEAELAHADQNRQIAVAQARTKAESAHFVAEAEVTRAEGIARANEIIGKSLQCNEDYTLDQRARAEQERGDLLTNRE